MSKALCCYAFETLYTRLNPESKKLSLSKYYDQLNELASHFRSPAPLFITWNQDDRLRGCIGTFLPLSIESGISRFSLTAALQDPRFHPISKRELNSSLKVSVTLLDNFVEINTWDDWKIGLHGLRISFEYENDYYLGTFLPSVAEEENWDQTTTLYYLLKKADYNGVKKDRVAQFYTNGLKEGWLTLTRYDGLKDSLTYDDFLAIRNSIAL